MAPWHRHSQKWGCRCRCRRSLNISKRSSTRTEPNSNFCSEFLFPLHRPPSESLISVRFGSVSGPFRVRFRVLGGVEVGSGRGASVREKNITKLLGDTKLWATNICHHLFNVRLGVFRMGAPESAQNKMWAPSKHNTISHIFFVNGKCFKILQNARSSLK